MSTRTSLKGKLAALALTASAWLLGGCETTPAPADRDDGPAKVSVRRSVDPALVQEAERFMVEQAGRRSAPAPAVASARE